MYALLDGQEQLLGILQSYFRNAATYDPDVADAGSTTYFSAVGMCFVYKSAKAMCRLKPTSHLFSQHNNLLQSSASRLRDVHEDPETGPLPDYLFFVSFTYAYRHLLHRSDTITTKTGRDFILAILQYRDRVIPRKSIEVGFFNSYGWVFDDEWPCFVDRARKYGIVVTPVAEEPLEDLTPPKCANNHETDHLSSDVVVTILRDHDASSAKIVDD